MPIWSRQQQARMGNSVSKSHQGIIRSRLCMLWSSCLLRSYFITRHMFHPEDVWLVYLTMFRPIVIEKNDTKSLKDALMFGIAMLKSIFINHTYSFIYILYLYLSLYHISICCICAFHWNPHSIQALSPVKGALIRGRVLSLEYTVHVKISDVAEITWFHDNCSLLVCYTTINEFVICILNQGRYRV